MNKKDPLNERTDISDIKEIKGEDGVSRHELNTPNKIIRWIKYKLEESETQYNQSDKTRPHFKYIDLSKCAISTTSIKGRPSHTYLSDILEENDKTHKLDCFINNGSTSIENTYYHEITLRVVCENSFIYEGDFTKTKFHQDVIFDGSYFKGSTSFYNCLFDDYVSFQGVTFKDSSNFQYCLFRGNALLHGAKFKNYDVNFGNCTFNEEFGAKDLEFSTYENSPTPYIDFSNSKFHKEVDLSHTNFDRKCSFLNSKIYDNIIFQKSHFTVSVNFFNAEINGSILFSPSVGDDDDTKAIPNIINKISFYRSKISGRIDFENCKIESLEACFASIQKGALFRIYKSKIKRLDFTSTYNDGAIMLEDNKDNIEEITFKSAINTGLIEIENTKAKTIKDRKTARLLKDSAHKSGNTIDGLNYKAKEMDLYRNELTDGNYLKEILRLIFLTIVAVLIIYTTRHFYSVIISYLILSALTCTSLSKWFVNHSIFKSLMRLFKVYPIGELLLLNLNTISNKNGLSWSRGLLFTFLAWVSFYGLFIMSRDGIGDTFFLNIEANREGFIYYLWLPSIKDLFIDDKTTGWLSSSIFIFGKIAIAYGIYQTITAFRKYKN